MGSKSTIEWTEATYLTESKTFRYYLRSGLVRCFYPRNDIFISLRRIATSTSRYNVRQFRSPAFRNGYNMVKSCRWRSTIGAYSVELFQDLYLHLRRYWLASALAAVTVLSSFAAHKFICRVSNSRCFRFVGTTRSVLSYQLNCKPQLTFTAPAQAFLKHQLSFSVAGLIGYWLVVTFSTSVFQSIKTRIVLTKRICYLPLLASGTFFQSTPHSLPIFFNANSRFLCSYFSCAFSCLCHIFKLLCPFNYNMKGAF